MIIGSLEDIVTRLDMRVNTLELRLKLMDHQPELQPEPQPDLEATIRSVRESNEGLRNLLADAKLTERDLDAEVVRLTKENQRLTKLAWQAEQDKQTAEAVQRMLEEKNRDLADSLAHERVERDRALKQRDALKQRLADEAGKHAALAQSVTEQRVALLGILGVAPDGPSTTCPRGLGCYDD